MTLTPTVVTVLLSATIASAVSSAISSVFSLSSVSPVFVSLLVAVPGEVTVITTVVAVHLPFRTLSDEMAGFPAGVTGFLLLDAAVLGDMSVFLAVVALLARAISVGSLQSAFVRLVSDLLASVAPVFNRLLRAVTRPVAGFAAVVAVVSSRRRRAVSGHVADAVAGVASYHVLFIIIMKLANGLNFLKVV